MRLLKRPILQLLRYGERLASKCVGKCNNDFHAAADEVPSLAHIFN